ncbi:hypothetical protein B0H21DRAFT_692036 [Amylocystis lapponica]|nr:hypothetical protein B0H21DRAFT_692036 [Amylocystis lapponica]
MQLRTSTLLSICSVFAAFAGHAASVPSRRQIISGSHGTINSPLNGSAIVSGSTVEFAFASVNPCESGYEPLTVWLLPTPADNTTFTSAGAFAEGSYLYKFGEYLVPNFGLPAMSSPPPPPSTLVVPTLDGVADASSIYFAVVETYEDCPPDIPDEYGLTSIPVVYLSG